MKQLKKVICYLLMFVMLFTAWEVPAVQAADNVYVSGATYPDWIKKGGAFILKGTVKSSSVITELTASLNDGHNNVMYSKTVRPNSTQYDLKGIDSAMRFDKLSANPYTYQVKVRNSSGWQTVIMKPFTVYSGAKPSFATGLDTSAKYRLCVKEDSSMVADIAGRGSGANVLAKKDNGQSTANWYLEYAGASAYMIKNADTGLYLDVAGGAYRNGTNVQGWTRNATEAQQWYFIPDGGAYKIISKNNYLTLSLENSLSLNKPNVQMWRDLGVAHQRFILKKQGSTPVASTLRISGTNTVPTLSVGQTFSLKGTIYSNYRIETVRAQVTNVNGNVVLKKEIYPNSTSANLSGAIDRAMTFNTLAAGTYYYSVWAEDASGAQKTFFNQRFEIQKQKSVTKILDVPHRYMKDSRWKNIKLGNSTIGKIGCVVCGIAEIESYMRDKNVYPNQIKNEFKFDKNGNIIWGNKYKDGGKPYLTNIYNSIVYDNKPVIAKLSNREHWIVIMGVENVTFTAEGKPDLYPSNFIVQDAGVSKAKKRLSEYGMKNYKGLSRVMVRK